MLKMPLKKAKHCHSLQIFLGGSCLQNYSSWLMRHSCMHSKSIFVGACVITRVAFQHCFLQLFVISIEVLAQNTFFGTYRLASVTILLFLVLRQSLLCCSCVSLLDHLYSHSSHWNSWYFGFF